LIVFLEGFSVAGDACCGGGRLHAQTPCLPLFAYCSNRSNHVFWDPWHPTEAANVLLVDAFLSGDRALLGPWTLDELVSN
jgi:phospholipase/lecithinase/hemolysin